MKSINNDHVLHFTSLWEANSRMKLSSTWVQPTATVWGSKALVNAQPSFPNPPATGILFSGEEPVLKGVKEVIKLARRLQMQVAEPTKQFEKHQSSGWQGAADTSANLANDTYFFYSISTI